MAQRSAGPTFAAMMMILIGSFHTMVGLIAIIDDEFYVTTRNYVLQFDTTQWGWIHLILGIVVAVAGGYLLTGSVHRPHHRRDHGVHQRTGRVRVVAVRTCVGRGLSSRSLSA